MQNAKEDDPVATDELQRDEVEYELEAVKWQRQTGPSILADVVAIADAYGSCVSRKITDRMRLQRPRTYVSLEVIVVAGLQAIEDTILSEEGSYHLTHIFSGLCNLTDLRRLCTSCPADSNLTC